jgi:hypothetical protein
MNAVAPTQIVVEPGKLTEATAWNELATAQAVVIRTDAATANRVPARVRDFLPTERVYLCRKAAESDGIGESRPRCPTCGNQDASRMIAALPKSRAVWAGFYRRYHLRFGAEPGIGAAEAYDAVRLLAASLRQSGPNRTRLRDALAGVSLFAGAAWRTGVPVHRHRGVVRASRIPAPNSIPEEPSQLRRENFVSSLIQ